VPVWLKPWAKCVRKNRPLKNDVNEIKIKISGNEAMIFLDRLAQIEADLEECVAYIRELKESQTSQPRKSSPKTV